MKFRIAVAILCLGVIAHEVRAQDKPLTERQAREHSLRMQRNANSDDVVNVNTALMMAMEKIKELESKVKACSPEKPEK